MARYILCPHCQEIWQISKTAKILYDDYKCPNCSKEKSSTVTVITREQIEK